MSSYSTRIVKLTCLIWAATKEARQDLPVGSEKLQIKWRLQANSALISYRHRLTRMVAATWREKEVLDLRTKAQHGLARATLTINTPTHRLAIRPKKLARFQSSSRHRRFTALDRPAPLACSKIYTGKHRPARSRFHPNLRMEASKLWWISFNLRANTRLCSIQAVVWPIKNLSHSKAKFSKLQIFAAALWVPKSQLSWLSL